MVQGLGLQPITRGKWSLQVLPSSGLPLAESVLDCGASEPGEGSIPAWGEWDFLILLLEPQAHTGWGPQSKNYNGYLVHVPDVRPDAFPVLAL